MQKICLGIIGTGSIGAVHMTEFSKLENVHIKAVTNRTFETAVQRAREFGIEKVYRTAEELIHDQDIDAVIVAVSNKKHAELTIQSLKAGKHVLIEKPMGMNANEAREIVRVQKETGKIVMVAHHRRWEQMIIQVKGLIQKGALGKIYYVKAGYVRRKGIPGWGSWFTSKQESGGGALIDIGVHMLDLGMWLLGDVKPVSVFGTTYAEFGPNKRGIGPWGTPKWDGDFDVDDLATAMIKLDNGATMNLEVSWAAHTETDNKPYIHVMGTEGGVSIRGEYGKFLTELYDLESEIELPVLEKINPREEMSKHFIDCIQHGRVPITSAQTGLVNNTILDAIYESSQTGNQVFIELED